jgi:transposase-like protein
MYVPANALLERGRLIAANLRNVKIVAPGLFRVRSQSSNGWYDVGCDGRRWTCQCAFNSTRRIACKHIYAVQAMIEKQGISKPDIPSCPNGHGAKYIIRRGIRRNRSGVVQRFLCKRCGRKFIPRTGFERMKHTAKAITVSLDLFFKGLSLSKIVDHLQQFHDTYVSDTTVYRWIRKYVELMYRRVGKLKPKLSDRWHADELSLKVGTRNEYMWNMLDAKTRFLIATQVTQGRGAAEATRLLRRSINRGRKKPKQWITDGLSSYDVAEQSELQGGRDHRSTIHISGPRFTGKITNNRIERFHGTVKERTKTMRGLRSNRTAALFAKGYQIYYNFTRPHRALRGKTPAEAAGLRRPTGKDRWSGLIQP